MDRERNGDGERDRQRLVGREGKKRRERRGTEGQKEREGDTKSLRDEKGEGDNREG